LLPHILIVELLKILHLLHKLLSSSFFCENQFLS